MLDKKDSTQPRLLLGIPPISPLKFRRDIYRPTLDEIRQRKQALVCNLEDSRILRGAESIDWIGTRIDGRKVVEISQSVILCRPSWLDRYSPELVEGPTSVAATSCRSRALRGDRPAGRTPRAGACGCIRRRAASNKKGSLHATTRGCIARRAAYSGRPDSTQPRQLAAPA